MSKELRPLTDAERREVNLQLCGSANEQRDEQSPPFRPRLSKPPKTAQEAKTA